MASPRPSSPPNHPKSILVNSNEPGPSRGSRSASRARVRSPPSDESIAGRFIKHRDGRFEYFPDSDSGKSKRAHDAEHKGGPNDRKFRQKRDGYESDEGETLRKEKNAGPRRRPPRDADGYYTDEDDARPSRPKSQPPNRRYYPDDDPYDAGPRRARYEDDYEPPRRSRQPPQHDRLPVRSRRQDDYRDDREMDLRRSKSDRRYRGDPRDRDYDRGDRRRKDKGKDKDKDAWKQQLMDSAMPMVKKEGGRLLKDFLANQSK